MGNDPGSSDGPNLLTRVLSNGEGRQMSRSGGEVAAGEKHRDATLLALKMEEKGSQAKECG